ncbi:39S ribosomal protein L17, mitochondrial-like [Paramacrobiotus metropolitanus]|uniref:39S ribosomal protein L17, mitochondrial-like n=1 Tax=Paramacrobiotus metropolitanus TaxID=2943436 RepID=UPI0024459256|nr:39S ribosomal protein L17, mitochondrial-like [Paramacrobiotus metropolitanus]
MTERLRVLVRPRHGHLRARINKKIEDDIVYIDQTGADRTTQLRKLVTGLFRYERVETHPHVALEMQGYAERLVQEALKYGPNHKPTMELMDFWMNEKDLIHKVFKVFVPRYQKFDAPYTKLHKIPMMNKQKQPMIRGVLEMKGNPYPPVEPHPLQNRNSLANILIAEAKKEYYLRKLKTPEEVNKMPPAENPTATESTPSSA